MFIDQVYKIYPFQCQKSLFKSFDMLNLAFKKYCKDQTFSNSNDPRVNYSDLVDDLLILKVGN